MPFSKLTSILLVLFALALTGYGGSPKKSSLPTDPTYLALEKIGNAYIRIDPPPQKKAELFAALQGFGKPEEILKSPNNGHEFIIVYGVKLQMLKAMAMNSPWLLLKNSVRMANAMCCVVATVSLN